MAKRTILKTWLTISIFLVVLGGPATAAGRTIYVDDDATGANNGSSWANAYKYLQDALADADSADKPVEIRVAQGIYKPDQGAGVTPGDWDATFHLINGVAIKGGYAGFGEPNPNARDIDVYETILSGDLDGNDVQVDPCELWDEPTRSDNSLNVVKGRETDGTAVLDGLTITGGNYTLISVFGFGGGAGMYNDYASSPTVSNCTFSGNSAIAYGGGMCNEGGSNPTLTNCVFIGNYAGYGGGMRNYRSSPTLANCTFSRNAAYCDGGMRNEYHSSPTLTNCTFSKNSGDFGGALQNRDGSNSTVTNCILWGNTPQEIRVDDLSMPVITYSDVKGGWPGKGNIDTDPRFANVDANDFHLKSQAGRWDANERRWTKDEVTSPCIDSGNPLTPIGYEPFPNGGIINMGAYGGTAKASKSYFGAPVCETIIAGDINGDCKVDFADFAIMAAHWLECGPSIRRVEVTDVKIIRGELIEIGIEPPPIGRLTRFEPIEEVDEVRVGDVFRIRIEVSNLGSETVHVFNLYGWDLSPQNCVEVIGGSVPCAACYRLDPGKSAFLLPFCPSQAFKAKEEDWVTMNIRVNDWYSSKLCEHTFTFEVLSVE